MAGKVGQSSLEPSSAAKEGHDILSAGTKWVSVTRNVPRRDLLEAV